MPTAETILRAVRDAAKARKSETGERNAIQATLARYGHLKLPKMYQGRVADGRSIRVYVWEEALEAGPEGDLLLVTGPDIEGEVHPARAVGFRAEGGQAVFTEAVPWGGKGKSQAEAGLTERGNGPWLARRPSSGPRPQAPSARWSARRPPRPPTGQRPLKRPIGKRPRVPPRQRPRPP